MAKKKEGIYLSNEAVFYNQIWNFYQHNKKHIRTSYKSLTKKILAYNDPEQQNGHQYLRKPQFEALEMYVFIKEFLNNAQVSEIFDEWRHHQGKFATAEPDLGVLFWTADEDKNYEKLFNLMKDYQESYPNYIYALTMGLGKTTLIATCIFYEFLLAKTYPKDERFCHNALVFAPDKTVLQSLREILTLDKSKVIPPEYVPRLDEMLKFHFLEEQGTMLNTLDNSDYNIVISNTQKIIVKKKNREETATESLFKTDDMFADLAEGIELEEAELTINQRFEKLCRLPQLGVYVDEAHHLFGANLLKELRAASGDKTSLRNTVNKIAAKTSVVACFNYTGTPYVEKQILPEVVYACGLKESIMNNYLKDADPKGYENFTKSEDFLRDAITDFWNRYSGRTYEGLTPKIAIFASRVEEACNEVRPAVEKIIADLGISTDKILVNTGDPRYTKDEDIRNFNNLDVVGSVGNEKQFIILVNKGREGWNCKSLMAIAMYRSPNSKIFVLQATMRCMRKITDEQLTARVYLSAENFNILKDELEKNFNMNIDDLGTRPKNKKLYRVMVVPPIRTARIKRIKRLYKLEEKQVPDVIDFEMEGQNFSKYEARVMETGTITESLTTATVKNADELIDKVKYSRLTLVAEISRYMNIPCLTISELLSKAKEGSQAILNMVNKYNDTLYDIVIPKIFSSLYDVKAETITEEKEVEFLKQPKEGNCYEFVADPQLAVTQDTRDFTDAQKAKTFHASAYCFDSRPELKLFGDYLRSKDVKTLYFTGMFTSEAQTDFAVQYYDEDTQRIRSYYPDFYAIMEDGSCRIIEVKGDNKVDDDVVLAKAKAAEEFAFANKATYKLYKSGDIMQCNVLEAEKNAVIGI